MSVASERLLGGFARRLAAFGASSGTYAQGSTTDTFTEALRSAALRTEEEGAHVERVVWEIKAAELSSVTQPGPRDTVTVGSDVWTVQSVTQQPDSGTAAIWVLEATRQLQRAG